MATVTGSSALVRHLPGSVCPVCSGHSGMPSGRGVRCAGFTLDTVAYCTREELAGSLSLDVSTSPAAYRHRLFGDCGCGEAHGRGLAGESPPRPPRRPRVARAELPLETRDAIYRQALSLLDLRAEAEADLVRRGLSQADIEATLIRSIPRKGNDVKRFIARMAGFAGGSVLRSCPGFVDKNGMLTFWSAFSELDGYVVPYVDERGRVTGIQKRNLKRGPKYVTAAGTRQAGMYHVAGEPRGDLWVTEGGLKAEVASRLGRLRVMGVPGLALTGEHIERIRAMAPSRVVVALDREANPDVEQARARWLNDLWRAGLRVYEASWDGVLA